MRQLVAYTQHRQLSDRLDELAYVQQTYDESANIQAQEQVYVNLDQATVTKNEKLLPLIEQLEKELPSDIKVESIQTDADTVSINLSSEKQIVVGQMLLNFQNVTLLTDLSIPSMSEQTDEESGVTQWTYTLNAYYAQEQESEEQANE